MGEVVLGSNLGCFRGSEEVNCKIFFTLEEKITKIIGKQTKSTQRFLKIPSRETFLLMGAGKI